MKYHNKPDLSTISKSVCGANVEIRKDEFLKVRELENWMTPRLEPYLWKKYLWKTRYDYEKNHYDEIKEKLFGENSTSFCGEACSHERNSSQDSISKKYFLKVITKELRKGNKEVGYKDGFTYTRRRTSINVDI